jgi:hypothetical protein
MKHISTQALASRISLITILAQSMLDAVICMGHLLLGAALPDIFFTSFIWIAVIKLLLFSVFQMKIAINIYQAHYAQELINEGWRGFRTRIINMHLRFYGILLFVLMFGFSVPNK